MPRLDQRLKLLQDRPPDDVAENLLAALAHAEEAELLPICRALLRTRRPRAVAAVIGQLDRTDPGGFELLTAGVDLDPALRHVFRQGRSRAVGNAIAFIERRADPRLLRHLVDLLGDREEAVSQRAAEAMLSVTITLVGVTGHRRPASPAFAALDEAVTAAAASFRRHRRSEVLVAVAIMARRPGAGLRSLLEDVDNPAVLALRSVVGHLDAEPVRRNLLYWLTIEPLGRQVCRRLHELSGPAQQADMLAAGHLLRVPARRAAMRRVDRAHRVLPDPATAAALPTALQPRLIDLVEVLPLRTPARVAHLERLATLPAAVARLRLVTTMAAQRGERRQAVLERLAHDANGDVAALAVAELIDRSVRPPVECLIDLEAGPHAAVVRRVTRHLARSGVDAFFRRWLWLSPPDRRAAGLRLLAEHPAEMTRRLDATARGTERVPAVTAIELMRRLRLVERLEPTLLDLATAGDVRVAASAVAALGDRPSARAVDAMGRALEHADSRVSANAVEGLTRSRRLAPRPSRRAILATIAPFSRARDNRARANAVRALLRGGGSGGTTALRAMLSDEDPLHRVSGIWVAARAGDRSVLPQLRALDHDDIAEIRVRSGAAVIRLEGRAQSRSSPAPILTEPKPIPVGRPHRVLPG